MSKHSRNRIRFRGRRRPRNCSGIAASEFAIVLPILFIVVAGTVETYTAIQLRESVLVAAYEAARGGVGRHSTNEGMIAKADQVLSDRGVDVSAMGSDYIDISPDVQTVPQLTPYTVTVTAPTNGNTVLPFAGRWFSWFGNREVSASVTLIKEYSSVP